MFVAMANVVMAIVVMALAAYRGEAAERIIVRRARVVCSFLRRIMSLSPGDVVTAFVMAASTSENLPVDRKSAEVH
jgi:hypothetical protein